MTVRFITLALTVVVTAYGVLVARDFFRLSDHLVYLAVDDALANQAVMIATEGRYGFMSSPTVLDIPRHYGEVSYGPWYFFGAAGLLWLFGTGLTVVRSVHLWVVVGAAVAAGRWFGGLSGAVAAALFGLAAFFMFDTAMWPMARPDSMVAAFAVTLTITGGLAIRDGRPRDWFLAGLSAASGAFAHLIAWTLVPACLVLFAVWAVVMAPKQFDPAAVRTRVLRSFATLSLGGALGALTFYASFGFRFTDQLRMFEAYQQLIGSSDGYWPTIGHHLEYAFFFMPPAARVAFAAAIAACMAGGAMLCRHPRTRTVVMTWLFPPLLLWAGYLLSNGWYTNQHKGYAILHQIMGAWCVAAGVATYLRALELRRSAAWRMVASLVGVMVVVLGARQIAVHVDEASIKRARAERWVSIADHSARVLAPVAVGASAWGSVIFGIESPRRVQLVQFEDVVKLMERIPRERRHFFMPDYLVWGYPDVRQMAVAVLHGQRPSIARRVHDALDGTPYRLISVVAAPPYGVNRVYVRAADWRTPRRLPAVEVYDPDTRRWLNGVGDPIAVSFAAATPLPLQIGYDTDAGERLPTAMMTGSLSRGVYLLRVTLRPGKGSAERMLTAVADRVRTQTVGELGAAGDFSTYAEHETVVTLLSVHAGGVLQISQFDDGAGATLESIEVRPVYGLQPPGEDAWRSTSAVEFPGPWTPSPGVTAVRDVSGAWRVQGDATANGYQIVSAPVAVQSPQRIEVSLDIAAEQGTVCTGALDDGQERWIVPPDQLHDRLLFDITDSGRFWIVVANCTRDREPAVTRRFTLRSTRVLMNPTKLYTDRLMDAVFPPR